MKKFILVLVTLLVLFFVGENTFAQGHAGCFDRIYNVYPYTYYYYPYIIYAPVVYQPYLTYYPIPIQPVYYPYYYRLSGY